MLIPKLNILCLYISTSRSVRACVCSTQYGCSVPIIIIIIIIIKNTHYYITTYWTGLDWTELNWTELTWTELNWTDLNWTDLNWTELNWTVIISPYSGRSRTRSLGFFPTKPFLPAATVPCPKDSPLLVHISPRYCCLGLKRPKPANDTDSTASCSMPPHSLDVLALRQRAKWPSASLWGTCAEKGPSWEAGSCSDSQQI